MAERSSEVYSALTLVVEKHWTGFVCKPARVRTSPSKTLSGVSHSMLLRAAANAIYVASNGNDNPGQLYPMKETLSCSNGTMFRSGASVSRQASLGCLVFRFLVLTLISWANLLKT